MSVIEAPAKRQTVIKVEENPVQKAIGWMIDMIKDGHWCRDTTDNGKGQHCALGLISRASLSGAVYSVDNMNRIYCLLDETIPPDDHEYMRALTPGRVINGGTVRGTGDRCQRIATYNNISEGPDQVVEWFERARLLA